MKTLLFFSLLSLSLTALADCEHNREAFLQNAEALYSEYKTIDSDHAMEEQKKAFWMEGSGANKDKAIFIAHGYMGSPREMLHAVDLYKKNGYAIIGFLIPGHGANHKIANHFKNYRWISEMKKQLEWATSCFSEVKAVGFSTGGLLLHHYLLTNPAPASLKSMHYIAPYFVQRFNPPLEKILGSLVNGISVDTAYFLSRFRDLKVMTIDRQYYNQTLPVGAGLQVKELGLLVYGMKAENRLTVPVQLFLSEGDWTVDNEATKLVMNRDNEKVELVWYKGSEPHHMMVPSVSNVAGDVQRVMFEFK